MSNTIMAAAYQKLQENRNPANLSIAKHADDLLRGGYAESDVAGFFKIPVERLRVLLSANGLRRY